MDFMSLLLAFLLGIVIGSFLNVCIYRIPRGKSIVFPPSACPDCNKRLNWYELIPLLSFLIQKGRCRGCGGKISWRYPFVESITGLLFLLVFLKYGISLTTIKMLLFTALLLIITFVDIDLQIIPNTIVIPGAIVGLALSYQTIIPNLLGLLVGFGIIALIIIISGGRMGWGDSKLLAMIGAFLGWQATAYALFVGSFFGAVVGIALIIGKRIERKTPIPFGPFLSLGAIFWLFLPWWFS